MDDTADETFARATGLARLALAAVRAGLPLPDHATVWVAGENYESLTYDEAAATIGQVAERCRAHGIDPALQADSGRICLEIDFGAVRYRLAYHPPAEDGDAGYGTASAHGVAGHQGQRSSPR